MSAATKKPPFLSGIFAKNEILRSLGSLRMTAKAVDSSENRRFWLKTNCRTLSRTKNSSSAELLGSLSGFLVSVEPNLKIDFEPRTVVNNQSYRPDLILELDGQRLALDVKRVSVSPYFESASLDLVIAQLKSYIDLGETSYGIAYFFPIHSDDGIAVWLSIDKKMKYIYPVDREAYKILENDIAKHSSAEDADTDDSM